MLEYIPKTGKNAKKRNLEKIRDYLKKNPDATGVEISKYTGLTLPTVYSHLKTFQR